MLPNSPDVEIIPARMPWLAEIHPAQGPPKLRRAFCLFFGPHRFSRFNEDIDTVGVCHKNGRIIRNTTGGGKDAKGIDDNNDVIGQIQASPGD